MLKPLVMLCFKLHWYIFIYVETIGYVLSYIGTCLFMLKPLVMLCFKLHWYIFIYVETIGYVMF